MSNENTPLSADEEIATNDPEYHAAKAEEKSIRAQVASAQSLKITEFSLPVSGVALLLRMLDEERAPLSLAYLDLSGEKKYLTAPSPAIVDAMGALGFGQEESEYSQEVIRRVLKVLFRAAAAAAAERARADAAEAENDVQRGYYAELLKTCAAFKARAEAAEKLVAELEAELQKPKPCPGYEIDRAGVVRAVASDAE